jgi:hypothetical protein
MSELETQEIKHLKRELQTIHGKPQNIEISALKTIKAYDDAYAEKKMQAISKRDYPRSVQGYRACQRLLQFDAIVKPDSIRTVVNSMIFQPVTINNEKKYALYYTGQYYGLDAWESEIGITFNEGYYFKPKLVFKVFDVGNPYDSKTGEKRGNWVAEGYSVIHDILVPENPKERRKFIEKLIKDRGLDVTNCVFSYRLASPNNDHGGVHGQISYNNLCDLTVTQLEELQTKTYYKDSSGNLMDKDGYRIRMNNGKIEAIT